ncbi:MAG: hypothetical protein IPG44_06275 [Anaerolineales bacterium]|jgi:tetratricopeptide (TPR) repeat protein|nr:hypothetical protein [Anaerolineales bacterium]
MFRKNQNPPRSGFPFSHPSNSPEPAETFDEFMERLQSIFESEDADAYFDAIESAPARWQRKPEFMTAKAVGHFRAGEDEGMRVLDEIERVHPKYAPTYYYKAIYYIQRMFPARTLRMLNRAHALAEMDDNAEAHMAEMEKLAKGMIGDSAKMLGAPYETMEKAGLCNEVAQEKLAAGEWAAAEQQAREALRLIPHWVSPRNNRSFVLYYAGKVQEAIAEARKVLETEPENFHALKNLTIFYIGLNEEENAREYSRAMKDRVQKAGDDFAEYDTAISVLGLMSDHAALWELGQKFLKRDPDELMEMSWHSLGIAALRFGKNKEAQKLLEKAGEFYEPAFELASELRRSLKSGKTLVAPSYYSSSLGTLLPQVAVEDLIDILSKYKGDGDPPPYLQKKLDQYLQPRPYVINGLLKMLPDPNSAAPVSGMLLSICRPDVDARLLEFALGDQGDDNARLKVLSALAQNGRTIPPNPIRFWSVELGEWREVEFSGQMLTDDIELNISEEAAQWVEKAQRSADNEDKISYLSKAVQLDPQSGYAVHMLGIALIQNGQKEEGIKLAKRAVEVEPEYMFAYANLALLEAQEDEPNVELARGYIAKVLKAPAVTEQTAFIAHVASMYLAFDLKEFEVAKREFEVASSLRPDNPLLDGWEGRLRMAEVFSGGFFANFQKQSRERAHKKTINTKLESDTTSETTLNGLTREALAEVARFWDVTPYGRKAVLIANISREMRDRESLDRAIRKLSADEKNALAWVLENGGARSFAAFSEKWGNDLEESTYWQYHKPKTVMGRLRLSALLAKGTLAGEQVVFVPADIRPVIKMQ